MFKRILIAAVLAVLPASAALAQGAPDVPKDLAADAEKVVSHMETLSGLVTQSVGDCDAMAAAIDGYTQKHGAELGEMTAKLEAAAPEHTAALKQVYDKRTSVAGEAMLEGLLECGGHEGVAAAFARLERQGNPRAQAQGATVPVDSADIDKLVGHMEGLGAVMSANVGDCAKMAAGVEGFAAKHRVEIAELSAKMAAMPLEQQQAVEAQYNDRITGAMDAVMQGVAACGEDPALEAAMKALDL